ncbi:MAG: alanine--glyoxylate aminotransferase family protein, partial [Gemmatimonadota bacterium]|nr:alanine--glyoxylate aminotransferase family protein [Gemmatimonadota bacterium]
STPSTPPLTLLYALDAALDAILAETIEEVWRRHARLGQLVRTRLADMGIELFADPVFASDTVTAFRPPLGVPAGKLRDKIRADTGIEIAIGQGAASEHVNRIGHMGWVAEPELEETLAAVGRAIGDERS